MSPANNLGYRRGQDDPLGQVLLHHGCFKIRLDTHGITLSQLFVRLGQGPLLREPGEIPIAVLLRSREVQARHSVLKVRMRDPDLINGRSPIPRGRETVDDYQRVFTILVIGCFLHVFGYQIRPTGESHEPRPDNGRSPRQYHYHRGDNIGYPSPSIKRGECHVQASD